MTLPRTPAGTAHRRRALLLGSLLALSSSVGAVALLCWSLGGLTSARGASIPVAEGVTLLTAGVAGAVAAGLACAAVLGVLALRAGGTPDRPARGLRLAPRLATRSAAILLALAVTAPVAHAEVSYAQPHTSIASTSSAGAVVSSSSIAAHSVPARGDGESDAGGDTLGTSLMATTPPRPVPLPGWQSTRATPSTAAAATVDPSTPLVTPAAPRTPMVASALDAEVVVTRGDTLWSIAATHLGPGATSAQIAAHWPRWYEANRLVIGPDPDLILPGHILQPPTPSGEQP